MVKKSVMLSLSAFLSVVTWAGCADLTRQTHWSLSRITRRDCTMISGSVACSITREWERTEIRTYTGLRSQTHEQMTVSCVEEIFAKYIVKAKRKYPDQFSYNYTPHSMRHTTVTHMLEAGVPLIVVKNFLGHVSLQTTQIYTEISQDTVDRQLKSWNDKWFLKDNPSHRAATRASNVPAFLI